MLLLVVSGEVTIMETNWIKRRLMNFFAPRNLLAFFPALLFALFTAATVAQAELTLEELRKTEAKIKDLSKRVLPATVSLIPGGGAPRIGTGSGVVVSADGLILTAAHVAVEMSEKVTVIFPNGDRANADVLGMDFSRDAAMLQITDDGDFPFVEIGDSAGMKQNEWCIALGHAGGYKVDRTPPVRLGRVIDNNADEFLTSDSALIGGDSGGPLFDISGKLIGIHSNIGFSLAQNRHVPISVFLADWEKLKSGARYGGKHLGGMLDNPDRPVMGALLEDAGKDDGALIRNVVPGSPAEKAGLEIGDTIVQVGPEKIKDVGSLMQLLDDKKPGDTLRMTVRNGEVERGVAAKLVGARALQEQLRSERGQAQATPRRSQGGAGAKPEEKPKSENEDESKPGAEGEKEKEKAPKATDSPPKPEQKNDTKDRKRNREERKVKNSSKQDDKAKPAPADPPKQTPNKRDADTKPKAAKSDDDSDDDKQKGKEDVDAETDPKLQAEFDKRMRESIREGDLEMSDEEFKKFGGAEGFAKLLREFQKKLTPKDVAELMRAVAKGERIAPDKFDPDQPLRVTEKFFREVLDSLRPLAAAASDATHLVFRGSEWKCLCTVVRDDGYAVTKFSEIDARNNQALNVLLEKGRLVGAEIVTNWPEYDLALIKLDVGDEAIPAVRWQPAGGESPELGAFLAAVSSGPDPVAIGVVSVLTRPMSGGNKGFLGIFIDSDANGVKIGRAQPGGPAQKGGLAAGDVITQINDRVVDTPEKLQRVVSGTAPGREIKVQFLRDGKELTKEVTLGDREELDGEVAAFDRANRMNHFGTEISRTSYGFQRALQSDLPIRPEQCGGPVINLDGEVVGLNIARGGRIKTFMLLAEDVAMLVDKALADVDRKAAKNDGGDAKEKSVSKQKEKAEPKDQAKKAAGPEKKAEPEKVGSQKD
jgi:serine protease Do